MILSDHLLVKQKRRFTVMLILRLSLKVQLWTGQTHGECLRTQFVSNKTDWLQLRGLQSSYLKLALIESRVSDPGQRSDSDKLLNGTSGVSRTS